MAIVIAVIGTATAVASMFTLVPRVKLVEAVTLFATAFGAGAALSAAVILYRHRRPRG